MQLSPQGSAQGRSVGRAGRDFGRFGGAGDFHPVGVWKILMQPFPALPKNLRMAVEHLDLFPRDLRHEAIFNAQQDLRTYFQRAVGEQIQGVIHGTLSAVFDRHHAVVRPAAGDIIEDVLKAGLGHIGHTAAKFIQGRLVGPCSLRSQIGNFQIFLQSEGSRHDLPVNGADGFLRQTSLQIRVFFRQRLQQCFFALGSVNHNAGGFFGLADAMHYFCPFVEQAQQFIIEEVDFFTKFVQRHKVK